MDSFSGHAVLCTDNTLLVWSSAAVLGCACFCPGAICVYLWSPRSHLVCWLLLLELARSAKPRHLPSPVQSRGISWQPHRKTSPISFSATPSASCRLLFPPQVCLAIVRSAQHPRIYNPQPCVFAWPRTHSPTLPASCCGCRIHTERLVPIFLALCAPLAFVR